ncbi:hypothetical protein [Streptomyces sp. NBC_01465]|uniref:hypothetical protein n=1 Tax=Streptomyces sp. NBC_01465 TaxID=2903878 RepID=UPI002E323D55|nr:hypothetical protein [Streptomyces sp. NBC_01465]
MNKNIRRSIAVAATVSGVWGVGAAASASAAELPVAVPHTALDKVVDGTDAQGTVAKVTHAAQGKGVGDVRAKAAEAAAAVKAARGQLPTQTPQTPELPSVAQADEIDYLFGPLDQIPGYAQSAAQGTVQNTAGPAVAQTADSVLPPVAGTAVDGVLPVVGQAVGDVTTLAQGVTTQVQPFAQGVVSGVARDAQPTVAHAATGATATVASVTPSIVTDALPAYAGHVL